MTSTPFSYTVPRVRDSRPVVLRLTEGDPLFASILSSASFNGHHEISLTFKIQQYKYLPTVRDMELILDLERFEIQNDPSLGTLMLATFLTREVPLP